MSDKTSHQPSTEEAAQFTDESLEEVAGGIVEGGCTDPGGQRPIDILGFQI